MPKNLENMSEDELTEYRAAADAEIGIARAKKAAVAAEITRREASALFDTLTDPQKAALAQHLTGVGAIESAETVMGLAGATPDA